MAKDGNASYVKKISISGFLTPDGKCIEYTNSDGYVCEFEVLDFFSEFVGQDIDLEMVVSTNPFEG